LAAIRKCTDEWIESMDGKPLLSDASDPVVEDFYSGASLRQLAKARDDLDLARAQYAAAVRKARAVGLSWGEIGRVLGVPRQALHRRFRNGLGD
jgi:DNA-directed RNA polymerase specialized sigma24 family protein